MFSIARASIKARVNFFDFKCLLPFRKVPEPKDALHNSGRVGAVRIGMGCKARFAANSRSYWLEMQRRRPPEAALAHAAKSYAERP